MAFNMLEQNGHEIIRRIGRPSGEYYIHDDAETVDIRPHINCPRPYLLRCYARTSLCGLAMGNVYTYRLQANKG